MSGNFGRDPLQILLEREARSCKGCAWAAVAFDRKYCSKGNKYGDRCKSYQEIKISQGNE